ncbi:uncharacterized protein YdeI (YjbR/CyaY-like superfamily) [Silvibacterium bohemicum]|uniref:Uncharacterized protein YdeI (YjbR/CyaY-like superfamily) n=1 Tax=Silvibacterium bohemicum TaxID=1577686 RepID=A0A841JTX5_9BACT|nr:YdeI/OmpD-associated family protein [Silvibacterium bohemicum]MBB6143955.1 uncharacterized protein YdeI (YjbR/CyaY-like superfamily) [Silvibacterium bohemicum]
MAKSAKTFKATLKPDGTPLNWTVVSVPRSVIDGLGEGKRPRVRGEINGFSFRTSLFSNGKGDFTLLVNKKMQKAVGVTLGSVAEFRLEPDVEARAVAMPPELKRAMAASAALRKYYDKQSYSFHKYSSGMITQLKSAEARTRQAERLAEIFLAMLEGEKEPPPILQAPFVRNPLAAQGWKQMTEVQRRGHLWGIFYYLSPESRQKRADKAVAEAVRIAKTKRQAGGFKEDPEL